MMSVFATRRLPEIGIEILKNAGVALTQWEEPRNLTRDELIKHCLESDALICAGKHELDAHFLTVCHHLKVIALFSVGYDHVAVGTAAQLNIPIGNTQGVLSAATADTAFLLMLAASRRAFHQHKKIVAGGWGFFEPTADLGMSLDGKTLGIFGLGKIGMVMAQRCVGAFGMKVIYHNRHKNMAAEKAYGAKWVSFDELLSQSDVLSVHAALTPETKSKFDKQAFEAMKPSALFINTARGMIHCENDLIAALNSGTIWGAGLDVTNPEPMHQDNALLKMPTVAILPHIGSATKETRDAMAILTAHNIIAGLNGQPLPNPVTLG